MSGPRDVRHYVRRCCWNFVPRSSTFLQYTAGFAVYGLFTTLVFGRSLFPVAQAVVFIPMSLEAYFTVSRGERWFLKWYALMMLINLGCCIGIGSYTLSGLTRDCLGRSSAGAGTGGGTAADPTAALLLPGLTARDYSTAVNTLTCETAGLAFAIVLSIGGSSLSLFASLTAVVAYVSMEETAGKLSAEDKKIEL